jgi:prevent-host-death family protein
MSTYSVAEAKSSLPALINRAMAGEEVIITRHGKPVVELRPTPAACPTPPAGSHEWFFSGRLKPKGAAPTSVELLNLIYDEPNS